VKALRAEGAQAEGLDLDPKVIKYASATQPGTTFHLGELKDLKVGPYDTITAMNMLEHATNPKILATHVLDKLVPGGYFIGTTPNISSVSFAVLGAYWVGMLAPDEHVALFSPKPLERCLVEAGFTDSIHWPCIRNNLKGPLKGLNGLWRALRRKGAGSAVRYVMCWCLENVALTLTLFSRRSDAGENLFFVARKPG
jgi:SAM-dependent methyltransferase